MTRIVSGEAGGRRLAVPPGGATRPTSDRAREALFSALEARHGTLRRATVLDLYAGSGALGLEALSRGAARAVLVESDARAARTARANLAALGLPGGQVVADRVERLLAAGPGGPGFDVVLADPPYVLDPAAAIAALVSRGWLAPGATVVLERSARDRPWVWPAGLEPLRDRRYGEAALWYATPAGDER